MGSLVGWILDTYIEGDEAAIWLKTTDSKAIKLRDTYQPNIYALPISREEGERLTTLLQQHPSVLDVRWVEKYTNLRDREKKSLLQITVDNASSYERILKILERLEYVEELFNTDLLHIQQYLFQKLGVEPTCKVEVEYNEQGHLISVSKIDDDREIEPPPFTTLHFNLHIDCLLYTSPSPRD